MAFDISTAPWAESNPDRVKLTRPVWVHYGHTDLEKMHKYYLDFGLVEDSRTANPKRIFYKGYNDQPVLVISTETSKPTFFGGAMEAASEDDLKRAASLEGASPIRESEFPGGGKITTIIDPDGLQFHVVYGYKLVPRGEPPKGSDVFNKAEPSDQVKPRRGTYQRVKRGPAPVHKLGHFGHVSKDLKRIATWYTRNFNIKVMDIQANPFNKSADFAIFYHLDLGKLYSDHHSFFHFSLPPQKKYPGPHHASFEVHDFDVQFQGHQFLHKQGYNLMWGVGRHLLGSQIFDYWYDHDGFVVEHYSDGDVVNEDNEPLRHQLEMDEYTAWSSSGINFWKGEEIDSRPNAVTEATLIGQSG